jgi:arginyl-tRNA--protein-N-Asp/Glu arginylyltransferase
MVTTGTQDTELIFINEGFIAETVEPARLDALLAEGWRHFGTHFQRYSLNIYEGGIRRVIPLRIRLADFRFSKSQRRILRRNADLETEIRPAEITHETHHLFAWHKRRFSSDIPPSIYTFLSETPATVPVECLEVCVRRGSQLVAASFLDIGQTSVSSVYGMYFLEDAPRSLGIFTMLKEIEFAIEHGKEFYYHGYCYEGESYYDYKKRFTALEAYDWRGAWHPFLD